MATVSPELPELMKRVALRDRRAFAELYRRTGAKLFGVCLRILKDRGEAEEVLQEVYVRVWQAAESYDHAKASPVTWLVAIARNRAIDVLRSRKSAASSQTGDIDDAAATVADPGPDPEAAAEAKGERGRIDACLDELEADRAGAVRLAYIDGASYQDLADRYRVPLNTMRTWLRRSLIRLRECLER